ncbi:hypothetical protein L1987_73826 [Smallanthus sonchifolius]|uniref:Uncharacterized protein n=1 Tax=Smallanthus sonchifolius TaxID=185202 RepID=A0ACB9A0B6_9ASTR|nr:hypothetical protein L1987_73826 [Smallanthus sonchifolius]
MSTPEWIFNVAGSNCRMKMCERERMNGRICSCKIEHPPHMFDEMLQRIDFLHWSTKPLFSLTMFSCLIEEYDSPTTLLENKSSSFSQLVAEYSMRSNSGHSIAE